MRRLFVTLLILAVMPAYSEGLIFYQDSTATEGRVIPVSDLTPLPVNADVSIGSITVEAFPVFADSTGAPATATVDASNRAVVNIGSETIGLIGALNPLNPTTNSTAVKTLVANTVQSQAAIANRLTVTYFNHSPTATVWVRHDGVVATVGGAIPVQPMGFLSFRVPDANAISLIASEAAKITVYQEGR